MIWLFVLLMVSPPPHAVYVSMTELTAVEPGLWEVECRIFNDDLEDALYHRNGVRPALRRTEDVERFADLIRDYVNAHLEMFSEEQQAAGLIWKNGIAENEVVLVRFTLPSPDITSISNTLLTELFPTQQNVVVVVRGDQRQYFRFDAQTSHLEIQ